MRALTDNEGRLERDLPNWDCRSVLAPAVGRYQMRNGSFAQVLRTYTIPFIDGMTGKPKKFIVWQGRCECCDSVLSWNANGTYAAIGLHEFDLVAAA